MKDGAPLRDDEGRRICIAHAPKHARTRLGSACAHKLYPRLACVHMQPPHKATQQTGSAPTP